ncbi:Molybdopterin molybdenumtransferase [Planctomycetes bacterium Pan216]|uniref:Molybdopterin molybdenumtransferase n=1 Tax=Kolteria novifilia TaxID=2527975 RepID=A0A518B7F1_9BACT|nr:Molybdopterin molybdenumtransferase [Planctomycetes bacterium Pan216]
MLTVDEALKQILSHAGRQPTERAPLADVGGLVLAEEIVSDIDSPPFAKSLMDGYAVRGADLVEGKATLEVIGELAAGRESTLSLGPGTAIQIMTGAPIPTGADAVVMVERSNREGDQVHLDDASFLPNQNIMPRGRELTSGQRVLEPGWLLGGPECGLLATLGRVTPLVHRRPRLAVLATGDEIVPPDQQPASGQIRNSNESTVLALAQRAGVDVASLGIVGDDTRKLEELIREGLQADVLVLTGGVSAGKKDFVPEVLERLGVAKVFHHVALKPGKPVWFGRHADGLVFGLPGNPVSVLVCFELFVRTALRARQSRADALPELVPATLTADWHYPTRRETYHPARMRMTSSAWEVTPLPWFGSPDLCAVTNANGLLVGPVTDQLHPAGSVMSVLPLRRD